MLIIVAHAGHLSLDQSMLRIVIISTYLNWGKADEVEAIFDKKWYAISSFMSC